MFICNYANIHADFLCIIHIHIKGKATDVLIEFWIPNIGFHQRDILQKLGFGCLCYSLILSRLLFRDHIFDPVKMWPSFVIYYCQFLVHTKAWPRIYASVSGAFISTGNGFWPIRRQNISRNNADLLSIGPLETNRNCRTCDHASRC